MSYEQAWEQQSDLDALCKDRPLESSEPFPPNDYYGMADTLRAYSSYPSSLKALIPHGVYLNDHCLADFEREARLPVVLVYPDYRLDVYRGRGLVPVPSGSPFVYTRRLAEADGLDPPRRGLLYFPAHSIPGISVEQDCEQLASGLVQLRERYDPIRVCVHYCDYQAGAHESFVQAGFEVVSAGHIYDGDFMMRLFHLLRRHQYAASNSFSSHVFYSLHAGCTFFMHGAPADYRWKRTGPIELTEERQRAVSRMITEFSEPSVEPSESQLALADYYLGVSHILEPDELNQLLSWCEELDRYGGLFTRRHLEGRPSALPFSVRRRANRALRAGTALRKRILRGVQRRLRWAGGTR